MFTYPQTRNQYQITHKIGSGQFSDVYMARCIPNNEIVTIKIYNLEEQKLSKTKSIVQTIKENTSFWFNEVHQNLIRYHGSFYSGFNLWTISEFMDCGCCNDALNQLYPKGIDNEILISSILKPVLSFLNYFHKENKVYGRVNSNNIFFSTQGDVKMNLVYIPAKEPDQYVPPEVKNPNPKEKDSINSDKIDIYDIGITAITLATGKIPDNNVIDVIRTKSSLPNATNLSSSFFDFVNSCLKTNPAKRPTAEQLLQHKLIKGAQDQAYLQAMLTSLLLPMNQRYETLVNDGKANYDDLLNHDTKASTDCPFDFGTASEDKTTYSNKKKTDSSKNSTESINNLRKKTIGRVTLTGPKEVLAKYNDQDQKKQLEE